MGCVRSWPGSDCTLCQTRPKRPCSVIGARWRPFAVWKGNLVAAIGRDDYRLTANSGFDAELLKATPSSLPPICDDASVVEH